MKIKLGANVIYVSDLPRAKEWYENILGMKTLDYRPPEFLETELEGAIFNIETENPKRPEGFREVRIGGRSSIEFIVENIKEFIEEARTKGVKIVVEPVAPFWGGWNAVIADPDGNEFTIHEEKK